MTDIIKPPSIEEQLKSANEEIVLLNQYRTDERNRISLLKRKISIIVGKLQNELTIGDARYKLRKELESLLEEL